MKKGKNCKIFFEVGGKIANLEKILHPSCENPSDGPVIGAANFQERPLTARVRFTWTLQAPPKYPPLQFLNILLLFTLSKQSKKKSY